jgi:hypothetical protein
MSALLLLVPLAAIVAALVIRQRNEDRKSYWPTIEATIETYEIQPYGRRNLLTACWLGYSFRLGGDTQAGEFGIILSDRDEAYFLSEKLKGTRITAHLNPKSGQPQVLRQDFPGYSIVLNRQSS